MTAPAAPATDAAPRGFAGWAAALLLLTVAAYHGVVALGWTGFDDTVYVVNNPLMRAADGLRRIWTTNESEQYYPLTFTVYRIQYALFGATPAGYHVVGLALHLANVLLLLRVLGRAGIAPVARLIAAGLFAVHPTQAMSVAWIAEHKNLLATLFMLVAIDAWIRSLPGAARSGFWYGVTLASFALAMLAKTVVLGLPLVLVAMDRFLLRRPVRMRRLVPMLVIAAGLAILTVVFEQRFAGERAPSWKLPWPERLQLAGAAPWAYLGRLLLPIDLSPAYELWALSAASLRWWMPFVITAAALAGLLAAHGRGWVGGHWIWGVTHFLVLLGPTLGLVPFANLSISYTSDHFLYPASMGLFTAAAIALERLGSRTPSRARIARVVAAIAIAACAALTLREVPVYRDAGTLWTRAVAAAPDNYAARLGLAESLRASGRLAEAMPQYETAVRLRPSWLDAFAMLGDAQRAAGDLESAEKSFRRAIELAPDNAAVVASLAAIVEQRRRPEEALALYEHAVGIEGSNAQARMGLAQMYLGYRRYTDALEQFRAVVAVRGEGDAVAQLGVVTCLQRLGRDPEAVAAAERGLALVPDNPPLLNMLARLRALSSDLGVRNPARALGHARRADEATGGRSHEILETLAAAQAATGDFAGAEKSARRAAELASKAGDARFAEAARKSADAYRAGRLPH